MVLLKRCPKCSGDLFLERDIYGSNLRCLQCGKTLNRDEIMALVARPAAARAA
jgi:hypothetical protein